MAWLPEGGFDRCRDPPLRAYAMCLRMRSLWVGPSSEAAAGRRIALTSPDANSATLPLEEPPTAELIGPDLLAPMHWPEEGAIRPARAVAPTVSLALWREGWFSAAAERVARALQASPSGLGAEPWEAEARAAAQPPGRVAALGLSSDLAVHLQEASASSCEAAPVRQ